jgi:prepilin-type N-terminal cleavage/methylation domain-containing protein
VTKQAGFTLLEMLIGLFILGAIMASFFTIVGNSLDSSRELTARNDIIQDAQTAQQLINARIQEACYIYKTGTIQMFSSGTTAQRSALGATNYAWTVGADPILAMILPPDPQDPNTTKRQQYRFLAYYPVRRQSLLDGATSGSGNPEQSPANKDNWVLMQYLRYMPTIGPDLSGTRMDPQQTCAQNLAAGNVSITGGSADLLVDYVQPSNIAPTYTMFSYNTSTLPTVTFQLRMFKIIQTQTQGTLANQNQIRFPTSTSDPMLVSVAPQNWCVGNATATTCP